MLIRNKKERKNKDIKIEKVRQNKKIKEDKNSTKGITLIALVITIIILLILTGVTIAMLTGENGILNKANTAQTETVSKGALEKVQVAIAGSFDNSGKTNDELLKTNLENVEGIEKPIPEITNKFTVKVDGVNIEITKDTVTGYVKAELGKGGNKPEDKNIEYKDGEKIAIIPKGFKVSDVVSEQKINTGLVVIAPDESEFVWIPVDKENLCVEGTAGKEIAEITTGSDYRGVLYDFSETSSTKKEYSLSGYREPDVVIRIVVHENIEYLTADGNTEFLTEMNNILGTGFVEGNDFKVHLQEEYNDIIKSIKQYGGYYVARYESSLSDSTETTAGSTGNIQSKKGLLPISCETNTWYGLYAKQKVYTKSLVGVDTNLKSSMIMGSMYDGMLNFALNGVDKTKVTPYSTPSTPFGKVKTGNLEIDKINNIYDLGNNLGELTLEAYDNFNRVVRRRSI